MATNNQTSDIGGASEVPVGTAGVATPSTAGRPPRRFSRGAQSERRLRTLVRLSLLFGVLAIGMVSMNGLPRPWDRDPEVVGADPSRGTSAAFAVGVPGARQAYLVATGTLGLPPKGNIGPAGYLPAVRRAVEAESPLAWSVWTDVGSFGQSAWRDLVTAGRPITHRPPDVDFSREVAVLIWAMPPTGALPPGVDGTPVPVPAAVKRASGLVLRSAVVVDHVAIGLELAPAPSDGAKPEPLAAGLDAVPYALVTIPRDQWPVPPAFGTGVDPVVARLAR
jgi:hypothetical protein